MLYCVYNRRGILADGFTSLDEAQQYIDDSGIDNDDVYIEEYDEEEYLYGDDDDDEYDYDDDDEYYDEEEEV